MNTQFIKKLRIKNQFTQEQIANELGISRPTYGLIEKGQHELSISEARKLAEILGITLENLINEQEPSDIDVKLQKSIKEKPKQSMRISVPQKNLAKFKEVLLYILEKVGSKPNVGETVLYKLLYFIDFDFYEKYEEQLIGATYMKNHYGPTPVEFAKIVQQMLEEQQLEKIKSEYFRYPQNKYLPLKKAELKHLSAIEKEHIDEVLRRLSDKSAKELTDYSHKDVPWITAKNGQVLNYESVFYRTEDTSVRRYDDNL